MDTTLELVKPEQIVANSLMHETLRFMLIATSGSESVWKTVSCYLEDNARLFCDESPMIRAEDGLLFRDGSSIRLIEAKIENGVTDIKFSVTRGLAFGFLPETDERISGGKAIGFTYCCKQSSTALTIEKSPITIRGE